MIKPPKTLDTKSFFFLILIFLIATDTAILLNIPFLRQIVGFLFLTILPGVLILQILKLNKIGYTEKFVLSVGLSVSFLMFFGLLINNLSLNIGYETPLATIPILITFNIAFVVLAILGFKTNKNPIFSLPHLGLTTSERAFLIVPITFPALSIFGMHVMNAADNNIILMFLLFLIPIYVIFVCFFNKRFPKRIYPVVIFLISISLLLLLSLRSNHIIGVDTHMEYYFFQITLDNSHWNILGYSTLDACLSISLLPTIYQTILNIPSEFLFKILYSLLFSIAPLIIYILSKKYIGELYGFLASCFFMFQASFLCTTFYSRTSIAILFFAVAMMVLFNDRIDPLEKRILFIVFMASCMVSHYSTTYIFFFIMLGSFLGLEILSKKYTFKKVISLTMVFIFFSMIFFWYSQVTETAFNAGVSFVEKTLANLNRFFIEESRVEYFEALAGQEFNYPILSRVNWIVTWSTFILIGIGVLTMIKRYKEMTTISIGNIKYKKPDFLKEKFEVGYSVIALACVGLLIAIVALPYISICYDIHRTYAVAITILSIFFVIGGITLSKHFFFLQKTLLLHKSLYGKFASHKTGAKRKSINQNGSQVRAYLIILLILIPYCMFTTGVIPQTFGVRDSIILNSEGKMYDKLYVHDQESYGAKWLVEYKKKGIRIYSDHYGNTRLTSQGKIPLSSIDARSLTENRTCRGYISLRYCNVVKGKLYGTKGIFLNISDYSHQFVGKSKIYANGGSEVYK